MKAIVKQHHHRCALSDMPESNKIHDLLAIADYRLSFFIDRESMQWIHQKEFPIQNCTISHDCMFRDCHCLIKLIQNLWKGVHFVPLQQFGLRLLCLFLSCTPESGVLLTRQEQIIGHPSLMDCAPASWKPFTYHEKLSLNPYGQPPMCPSNFTIMCSLYVNIHSCQHFCRSSSLFSLLQATMGSCCCLSAEQSSQP